MYQYKGFEDTIAAIMTPSGTGGVGIVRLSGADAFVILGRVFVGKKPAASSSWKTFTVHYGWIKTSTGDVLDEALVSVMRAPKSYTCEDVAEISCHGGPAAVRAVLELCLKNGARLAQPGEFTKRAFLNGRIDLAQAEAVLDVISAKTDAALRAGERQLKGELSTELDALRAVLLQVLAGIEAVLNFPEDDTDAGQGEKLRLDIVAARLRLAGLLSTAKSGRILKEGIKVVICGKPNVGKSSLLNALLRAPRAIVTDVAGTTRDVLEEMANIDGIPVNLVDTAGILAPRDKVEEEAVRRSRVSVESADIVLLVLDQSLPLDDADRSIMAEVKNPHIIFVWNKEDLPSAGNKEMERSSVRVSSMTRQGLDELKVMMVRIALDGQGFDGRGLVINDMRHAEALRCAEAALARAEVTAADNKSFEFSAEDIKIAVNELDAITGRNVDDDVLEQIFSKFCIGK
jgi:tRNA modification GTPase